MEEISASEVLKVKSHVSSADNKRDEAKPRPIKDGMTNEHSIQCGQQQSHTNQQMHAGEEDPRHQGSNKLNERTNSRGQATNTHISPNARTHQLSQQNKTNKDKEVLAIADDPAAPKTSRSRPSIQEPMPIQSPVKVKEIVAIVRAMSKEERLKVKKALLKKKSTM